MEKAKVVKEKAKVVKKKRATKTAAVLADNMTPNYYVIDGETYYKEVIQQFYDEAMAIIEAGGELSPEQLALLEIYREILK